MPFLLIGIVKDIKGYFVYKHVADEFIRTCISFVDHVGSFERTAIDCLQIPQNFRQLSIPKIEDRFVSRIKVIEVVGSCDDSLAAILVSFEEETS